MQKFNFITWNINSIRVRLPLLKQLLLEKNPEFCMLQEIKATMENFPFKEIEELGYSATIVGQKSYNGVAFLHRGPINKYTQFLPGVTEARYQSMIFNGIKFTNIYVPNGFDMSLPQYAQKLNFLKELLAQAKNDLKNFPCIIGGDFNIIPYLDHDISQNVGPFLCLKCNEKCIMKYSKYGRFFECTNCLHIQKNVRNKSSNWEYTGIGCPEIRSLFFEFMKLGYMDLGKNHGFTWRDYRHKTTELRIDHILASPNIADKILYRALGNYRNLQRPSDHFPIECLFI